MEAITTVAGLVTEAGSMIGGFFTSVGQPVLTFIGSNALTIAPALMGIGIAAVGVVRRFIYGA